MSDVTITHTAIADDASLAAPATVPGILVAYAPEAAVPADRFIVSSRFTVGRDPRSGLPIRDDRVSKRHLEITHEGEAFFIRDLGSTNGTFVNGTPLPPKQRTPLPDQAVVRAGRALLVFQTHSRIILNRDKSEGFDMAGPFHAAPLITELRRAAMSGRHVLLAGPSGTGKELSARALAVLMGRPDAPLALLPHNAAQFTSEEDAAATLFGVGGRVFSNVDARPGLIERAHRGALFLDEIHNLPTRVQRSLLRVMEDGRLNRIGETTERDADVRFILASNAPPPDFELAPDILARLRVVRVPPLKERAADIPTIFKTVLETQLTKHRLSLAPLLSVLGSEHYEMLLLDGFPNDNVRGVVDLADRLATGIALGASPADAVAEIFYDRFGPRPASRPPQAARQDTAGDTAPPTTNSSYEKNKAVIVAAYNECGGNITRTFELLRSRGVKCSRRWLAIFADEWGLREKKNRRR